MITRVSTVAFLRLQSQLAVREFFKPQLFQIGLSEHGNFAEECDQAQECCDTREDTYLIGVQWPIGLCIGWQGRPRAWANDKQRLEDNE